MNLFIQEAAEQDILRQVEWYAEKGLPDIARRFHGAVLDAIDAMLAMPEAGPPKASANPRLAGLRAWPVKGFDESWIYYLVRPGLLTVVRVLHSKRDIGAILDRQDVDEP
ncbi:MAG TPA: type II toxin-antitoxin system RelE/ParE family toxin [Acetobacteraceae bacterium]|nr:type II toxin-antitoxin system RelE/ParE family toxin [Acetobacteraceae bacterium]